MPDVSLLALLFLALVLLFGIALVASRMDFLQPAVIGSGVMAVSALFAVIGEKWWASHLSFEGFVIILLGMIVFVAAGLWTSSASRPMGGGRQEPVREFYEISWILALFFCALMVVMAYYNFQTMYRVSVELGNTKGYAGMFAVVRQAVELDEGGVFGRWMNYRTILAQMIASVYLYLFLYDVILAGWRWRFLAAIPPVLCYFPFLLLTTGRTTMLCFVIYGFVLAVVLYFRKHGGAMAARRRAVGYAVLAGVIFAALFFLMGLVSGKTGDTVGRSYLQIFAHYAGLSLPAFGEIIQYPVLEDGLIGSHTLGPLYRVLASLGLPLPHVINFMPFVNFSGIDTNVYTIFWRYCWDFGIVGMLLMMFLLGAGYTLAYRFISHGRLRPFALMTYALFVYPIFWFPMDDRFLMDVLNTTTLYDLVLLFVLYELLLVHAKKTPLPQRGTAS